MCFRTPSANLKLKNLILRWVTMPSLGYARSIPYTLCPAVENELSKLVKEGVLERVNLATTEISLASSIVIVKIDGCFRICSDY